MSVTGIDPRSYRVLCKHSNHLTMSRWKMTLSRVMYIKVSKTSTRVASRVEWNELRDG